MNTTRVRTLVNTLIVAAGYLMSRLLGVIRDVFITAQFGTSPEVDAYRAAFAIPDLIYLVVAGGALGTALIPVFQQQRHDAGDDAANRLASSILNLMFPILVVMSLCAWIWAEPLVALTTARGFDATQQQLTATLMRWLLLQPILLGIGGIFKAILEAHEQFSIPTLGANLYNIGIIAGAALFAPFFGIHGIIYGVLCGAVAFSVVQLPSLRRVGWRYASDAWQQTPGLTEVWRLLLPRIFGQSIWQINLASMIGIISTFGVGAVAASGYAMQLMLLPHGLVGLSIGTVMFPRLAQLFADGDDGAFAWTASRALQTVLAVTVPTSIVMWYAAPLIVRLLFQRGSFDDASAALTVTTMQGYMIGLAGFCVAEIAVRIWFARKNTRLPVLIGACAVILNVTLGWALTQSGNMNTRLFTIATVFSVANVVEATLLIGSLWYYNRAIIPMQRPLAWCIGIGGLMVLLQLASVLPPILNYGTISMHEFTTVLVHLLFYAGCGAWGIGWCSQGFGFVRARFASNT
ncbi:MAG: hypothetical protein RL076_2076 [Chloroflexota bacterium]|jgi:putative peptidoglycan lipid II flippase